LEPRHRLLFIGPPGNGKTSLAEAIAGELSLPLLRVRYDAVIGSYLGETASRLARLFDHVRTRQCVLFFDEFDALGKERGDEHETGEIKRVVNSLLLSIDALPSYVVVIGASNHPELLDRAVWRRFQVRIELPPPGPAEVLVWLRRFEANTALSLGISDRAAREHLGHLSYAELQELLKALVVHTAEWHPDVEALCGRALADDVDRNRLKDHLSGLRGHGTLRPERALGCSATRATAVGGGLIAPDYRLVHRFPVPVCLQARSEWRRVTLTLAWFTPVNPADRRYRMARLRLEAPRNAEPLHVTGGQVHGDAAVRGTVQHVVLEAKDSAMLVADDATIAFVVTCAAEAGELDVPVPYAVAVSLETAPETGLPIYAQVAERPRTRAPVRPRP
ncbi:MAG TPA: ATP-binding protein, partial [Polyangiaceae bacterium]